MADTITLYVQTMTGTVHSREMCGVTGRSNALNTPVTKTPSEMRVFLAHGVWTMCMRCKPVVPKA